MSAAEISIILSRQLINQLVNKLLLKWEKRFPLIHNPTNVISCLGLIVPTPTRESPEAHSGNLLCTLSVSKHSLSASIGGFSLKSTFGNKQGFFPSFLYFSPPLYHSVVYRSFTNRVEVFPLTTEIRNVFFKS